MPTISVIIPIYNVEQYICQCIESLLNQTYFDYELILVDDGSTDNSIANILHLVEGNTSVRIIRQENRGVSIARNTGISSASGDWIIFVDSDDTVLPDYLETLASGMCVSDLVLSGDRYIENGRLLREDLLPEWSWESVDGWDEMSIRYLENMTSLHGKLFRRDIIIQNSIQFDSNLRYGEDRDFCISYLSYVYRLKYLNYAGYCYRTDVAGSLSKQKIENMLQTDLQYWNKVHQIIGESCPSYQVNRLYNCLVDNLVLVNQRCGLVSAIKDVVKTKQIVDSKFLHQYCNGIVAPKWMRLLITWVF